MAIDRDQWQQHLTRFHAPRWLCPRCGKGHLALKPESVVFLPSAAGYARLSEDPEDRGNDLELRFSALLQCDYNGCQESASVAGIGLEKETYESGRRELYAVFFPTYVNPSPDLFPIPTAAPAKLQMNIRSAFVLSWGDYDACLNRVRLCLETLLDLVSIPRSSGKGGTRQPLNLHRRIEMAHSRFPGMKPFLMAAKHLGNAGSHLSGLKKDDVFDCFDLLEAVVIGIYGDHKRVARLANRILKARGPVKRKAP
jgi:hypothetical protein